MMSSDSTRLLPRLVWDDPRVHLLDDVWLLTIFAILAAIAVPWFLSGFEVPLGAASLGLLALGALHLAFTGIAAPTRPHTVWRDRGLTLLHIAGVVVIGFIWLNAGGLQNPEFLAVFALPVIGAIFISRWHPYLTALIAMTVVAAAALIQVPELRWFVSGFGTAGAWVAHFFGSPSGAASAAAATGVPFSGFYAPSSYFVVLLEVFAILLAACAVAAEYLGTVFERLYVHLRVARAETERSQDLWTMLIEQLPMPALLLDADTAQVVCASALAVSEFCGGDSPVGRKLFEIIRFSYPDIVHGFIVGDDGALKDAAILIGEERRIAQVRVHHVAQKGHRFALVLINDTTQAFCSKAALDAAEHAALVIDAQGRVLAFNKPASGLFTGIVAGLDASTLLTQSASSRWWDPGATGRRKTHVEISPRIYQLTSSVIVVPGEDDRMYAAAFLPVAKAAISDQLTADATMVTPALVVRKR